MYNRQFLFYAKVVHCCLKKYLSAIGYYRYAQYTIPIFPVRLVYKAHDQYDLIIRSGKGGINVTIKILAALIELN